MARLLLITGCVLGYVFAAIACYEIVPPLQTGVAFFVASAFVAVPAIVLAFLLPYVGEVLLAVSIALGLVAAFTVEPGVTTAGHWGIAAAVAVFYSTLAFVLLDQAEYERELTKEWEARERADAERAVKLSKRMEEARAAVAKGAEK